MATSRRRILLAGVPALGISTVAASLAGPAAPAAAAVPGATGHVPAPELGISPANSAATNRANLVAALSNSAVCVLFPPGDYLMDNADSQLRVSEYSGELVMQPGARFVFTSNTTRGMIFAGGTGARLYGLSTGFATQPPKREWEQECLIFDKTTDTYLENVRIDGSAAAGLLFWQCVRPTVVDAIITNTMADGLNFANCQDGRADHITTIDTGDDGVAFGNVDGRPDYTGGLATNISVTRSKSRGVAVIGQRDVTVRDVSVDTTVGHGLYCAYESNWNTRTPTNVHFERARVVRGGAWTTASGGGTNCGVRVNASGAVTLTGVTVDSPGAHGAFLTGVTATMVDITVRNVPVNGVNLQSGSYLVDRLTAENTNSTGLSVGDCRRLEYGTVTLRNTSITNTGRYAVAIRNTALVFGDRLWIADTQQTATGYTVATSGTQKGGLGVIIDLVDSRGIVIDNASGLSYSTA